MSGVQAGHSSESGRKKRVCVILRSHYSAVMGGAQYQAKIIVEQLLKLGTYEVFYLAAVVDPHYCNEQYEVVAMEPKQTRWSKKATLFDRGSIRRRLQEIAPDVIYQNALTAHTAYAADYAKKHEIPFIFHIASDFDVVPGKGFATTWKRKLIEKAESWLASKVLSTNCRIVAQTQTQSALLLKHFGRSADLIMPNLLPCPKESIQSKKLPFTVIWVANLKPVKRPELFLRLAKDLQGRSDARFIMIGRRSLDPEYEGLYDLLAAQSNLQYLGPLSQEEVNVWLERAHVLVNTSDTEGYSNTYVQAWMRNTPVVSLHADVDGVLARGELGFLAGNGDKLAEQVLQLIEDNALREKLGNTARDYSIKNNSLNNIKKLITLM